MPKRALTNWMIAGLLIPLIASGCWTHRIQTMSPVASAGADSARYTNWAFLWRSNIARPSNECMSKELKDVVVKSNWGFSLIRAGTLGLVAPITFERGCAAPMIDAEEGGKVASHGATHVAVLWDAAEKDPVVACDKRAMTQLAIKPNPFFDIISAATLGLISPVRRRAYCAADNQAGQP